MSIIGPLEIQIVASAPNFRAQLERQLAPGLAGMNRQIDTAVKAAAKDLDRMGDVASRSLARGVNPTVFRDLNREVGRVARTLDQDLGRALRKAAGDSDRAFDGLATKVDRVGDTVGTSIVGALRSVGTEADRAGASIVAEFRDTAIEAERALESIDLTTSIDVDVDTGALARDIEAGAAGADPEVTVDGAGVAAELERAVRAANLQAEASVDIDRAALSTDVAAALGDTSTRIGIDASHVAGELERAAAGTNVGLRVDRAGIARQVSQAVGDADRVGVDTTGLADQVVAAIQEGLDSANLEVGVAAAGLQAGLVSAAGSGFAGSLATGAAANLIAETVSPDRITNIAVDVDPDEIGRVISDGLARTPLRVDREAITRELDAAVTQADLRLSIAKPPVIDALEQAAAQADIRIRTDGVTRAVEQAVAQADIRLGLGASPAERPRSTIPIRPDYQRVAADIEEAVSQADIRIRVDDTAIEQATEDLAINVDGDNVADQLASTLANADLSIGIDYSEVADRLRDTVNQTDLRLNVDTAALSAKIESDLRRLQQLTRGDLTIGAPDTVERSEPGRILGASARDAIPIRVDYNQVARDLESAVNQADLTVRPDFVGVAADLERLVSQADIVIRPDVDRAAVERSLLGAVEQADIVIRPDFTRVAADLERAVDRADIVITPDFAKVARDLERVVEQTDIQVAVGVDTRVITVAERRFDAFVAKLRDGADVDLQVDTDELRRAFDLAERLSQRAYSVTVNSDATELKQVEELAKSLESFAALIDVKVGGKGELLEALNLADSLERVYTVAIDVKGRDDLAKAEALAADLDQRRTVTVDVDTGELKSAGAGAGADFLAGFDGNDVGAAALDGILGSLGKFGPFAAIAGPLGATFGGDFVEGFTASFNQEKTDTIRALSSGLAGPALAEVGRTAGSLYAEGFGESKNQIADIAATIESELRKVDPQLDLTESTRQAIALSDVLGVDVAQSIALVNRLIARDLVPNTEAGFNLLFDLGQQTGLEFEEMLELTDEFGASLARLGIDGPQGLYLIGEAVERGVFAQLDQAGEVFEEFSEALSSGASADALDEIGVSAQLMQDKLADGRGAEAMAEIATALLDIEDPALRDAKAAEIFGGNMALATNPEIALELFAQADGLRDVGDGASDAADGVAGAVTELERLQRRAGEAGGFIGGLIATQINTEIDLATGIWNDFGDSVAYAFGQLGLIETTRAPNWFGLEFGDTTQITGVADALAAAQGPVTGALDDMGEAGDDTADSFDDVAKSAEQMITELEGLFQFDADELLRGAIEQSEELVGSFDEVGGASIGLAGSIDVSTEAGRNLQQELEGISGLMADTTQAYIEGKIGPEEYATITAQLEDGLVSAAAQAGVTGDKVDGLTDKYLRQDAIGEIVTTLTADDQASGPVSFLDRAINAINLNPHVALSASDDASGTVSFLDRAVDAINLSPHVNITAADRTGGIIDSIRDKVNSLRDRTVTINAVTTGASRLSAFFAQGGIADEPSVFGEDGRELALPLEKPGRMDALLRAHAAEIAVGVGGIDRMFNALTAGLQIPTPDPVDVTTAAANAIAPPPAPFIPAALTNQTNSRTGNTHYHNWYLNEPEDLWREVAHIDQLV